MARGGKASKAKGQAPSKAPQKPKEVTPPKAPAVNKNTKKQTSKNKIRKPKVKPLFPLANYMRSSELPTALQGGFVSDKSATKELVVRYTEFHDSNSGTAPTDIFQQMVFDIIKTPFGESWDNQMLARVTEVRLSALPAFDVDTSKSTFIVAFAVPAINSVLVAKTVGQQTTVLTPGPQSKWVTVGHYKASQLFRDAETQPAFRSVPNDANIPVPTTDQCLWTSTVLDPETLAGVSDHPIQFRTDWTVAYPLPVVAETSYQITSNDSSIAWHLVNSVASTNQRILAEIAGMSNIV